MNQALRMLLGLGMDLPGAKPQAQPGVEPQGRPCGGCGEAARQRRLEARARREAERARRIAQRAKREADQAAKDLTPE